MTKLRPLLETALGVPFVPGNRVDVLRNGVEIFPAMLDAIDTARTSVDFQTFVFWEGDIADRFARHLSARAEDGLRVRVLLDTVGARTMAAEHVDLLRNSGCQVRWFRPPRFGRLSRFDHRSHRKVLACDGRVGFTGGVGIAQEWEGDARGPDEWRETHFRMEGPAVAGLDAAFLQNWAETDPDELLEVLPPAVVGDIGNVTAQVVRTSAASGWSDAATLVRTLLGAAERTVRITTAYFVPDAAVSARLIAAVERGVEVDIIVPGEHVDQRLSQLAGEDVYQPLLEAGCRIWTYVPTMMHAKILTVDGTAALIGSVNVNQRSLQKDDEIAVVLLNEAVTELLDRQFVEDRARSRPIDLSNWRRRGPMQRAGEVLASLFRRQL